MNGVQALQTAFGGAHLWYSGTVADLTAAQANMVPPGVAHPIGELMAHVVHSEDGLLAMVRGTTPLWVTGGWAAKTGQPAEMVLGQETASARAYTLNPATFGEYTQAVFAQTDAYLASLSDADLDQEIDMSAIGFGTLSLARFLGGALLGNTYAHTGEISTLKGMQSAKGYPF